MPTPAPLDACIVFVTVGGPELAQTIARSLVEERLAACVNVLPGVTSIYRWEGRICEDAEVVLVIKTTAGRLDALTSRVRDLHTYQVPEVVAVPIVAGSAPYLAWVAESVVPPPPVLRPSEPTE